MSLSLVIVLLFPGACAASRVRGLDQYPDPLLAVVLMLLVFTRDGLQAGRVVGFGAGAIGPARLWGWRCCCPFWCWVSASA